MTDEISLNIFGLLDASAKGWVGIMALTAIVVVALLIHLIKSKRAS